MGTDQIFPDNWREVIKGKKVILYNTGVSSLLQNREKHIEKMKWVFEVFQQHPEVVLWWRPHPLELGTIESMVPELAKCYTDMRKQYKDENVGILDESSDLHRAIAISDAYYGDWSSVVHLYRVTKKPILLSNDSVMEYSSEIAYMICDFVIIDDYMWFITSFYTGLFKMNLKSFVIEDIIWIPGERIYEPGMLRFIVEANRDLFLVPDWGSKVIVYNIDANTIRSVGIGMRTMFSKFSAAYLKENYLYLIYTQKNCCLKINIKSLDVQQESIEEIKIQKLEDEKNYIVEKTINNKIYAFFYLENMFQITDIKTKRKTTKKIGIVEDLKKIFFVKHMFDIYEKGVCVVANSFYAGEHKCIYTLPRYIDAVVYEKDENGVNRGIDQCGKKIYEVCKYCNR